MKPTFVMLFVCAMLHRAQAQCGGDNDAVCKQELDTATLIQLKVHAQNLEIDADYDQHEGRAAAPISGTIPVPPLAATQATTDASCFEKKVMYKPGMEGQSKTIVSSAEECQQRCSKVSGCAHFSWFGKRGNCHLQDGDAKKEVCQKCGKLVSGPPACVPPAPASSPATSELVCSLSNPSGACPSGQFCDGGQCKIANDPLPGAPWTEEEALVVMAKLLQVGEGWMSLQELTKFEDFGIPWRWNYSNYRGPFITNTTYGGIGENKRPKDLNMRPSYPMMLRFGFHSCLKQKDGSGGCNGRMNIKGAFKNWGMGYDLPNGICTWQNRGLDRLRKSRIGGPECYGIEGEEPNPSHNANLPFLADRLEKIYNDPSFPSGTPVFGKSRDYPNGRSLKASGKSRADLWALTSLVGAWYGLGQANKACDEGQSFYSAWPVVPCKMNLPPIKFFTGRRDSKEPVVQRRCDSSCLPGSGSVYRPLGCKNLKGFYRCEFDEHCRRPECHDCEMCRPAHDGNHMPRPYESTLPEDPPIINFNGSDIAKFFDKNFGFSKREAIAILGAHSFGRLHGGVYGAYRYDWTHQQVDQLNNVYYRVISHIDGKHFERHERWNTPTKVPTAVGTVQGKPARTFLSAGTGDGKDIAGGPFQWFHAYERCPFCTEDGLLVDRHLNIWGKDQYDPKLKNTVRRELCCDLCKKATKAVHLGLDPKGTSHRRRRLFYIEGLNDEEKEYFTEYACVRNVSVHETMVMVDVALHDEIQTNDLRAPIPCKSEAPEDGPYSNCPKNTLQDAGDKPMWEIVEDYAHDQDLWVNDFVNTMQKMLTNGVTDKLQDSLDLTSVTCEGPSKKRRGWECKRTA